MSKLIMLEKSLDPLALAKVEMLVQNLGCDKDVLGILLGGSLSYKNAKKADVDLFCLVQNRIRLESQLKRILDVKDVSVIVCQGYFPWTGYLHTAYFESDFDLSVDICLVEKEQSFSFFWEPNGMILLDKQGLIGSHREHQMLSSAYTKQPFLKKNPWELAVVTLKKIDKNLERNHLWNALELINILRRYVMQIWRIEIMKNDDFLGRVDRDFEDVCDKTLNAELSRTIPSYRIEDIMEKAILLSTILENFLNEFYNGDVKGWLLLQVKHEIDKLNRRKHA